MKIDKAYYNIVDWEKYFRNNFPTIDELLDYVPYLESTGEDYSKLLKNIRLNEEEFIELFSKTSNKDFLRNLLLNQDWLTNMKEETELFFKLQEYKIPILDIPYRASEILTRSVSISIRDLYKKYESPNYNERLTIDSIWFEVSLEHYEFMNRYDLSYRLKVNLSIDNHSLLESTYIYLDHSITITPPEYKKLLSMERESFIEYANIIISRTYKNYDELIEVVEKHIKKVPREIFNRTSIAYRDLKQYQKDKGEL